MVHIWWLKMLAYETVAMVVCVCVEGRSLTSSSVPPNKYTHDTYPEIPSEEVRLLPSTHTHTTMATVSSANIFNHQICTMLPNNDRSYNPMELE